MKRLNDTEFSQVVKLAPLVAMDLIIRDPAGLILLGRRNNQPARNMMFAPGGRIRKNEPLAQAFARILETETGLSREFSTARLLGAYDHFYDTNTFNEPGYGTHYVTLGYELHLQSQPTIRLDSQHDAYAWLSVAEILSTLDVHDNTKAYFR